MQALVHVTPNKALVSVLSIISRTLVERPMLFGMIARSVAIRSDAQDLQLL